MEEDRRGDLRLARVAGVRQSGRVWPEVGQKTGTTFGAHSEFGRGKVVRSPPLSAARSRKSARKANTITEIPLASAKKSISAMMKVFMANLCRRLTRMVLKGAG
jgi:hypothetical protein